MPDNIFALPAKDWEVAQMTHSLARRACIGRCPEKRHDYRNVFDLPKGLRLEATTTKRIEPGSRVSPFMKS